MMLRRIITLASIALWSALLSPPARAHDIGFYFDPEGTTTEVTTTVPDETVTAYLILEPKPANVQMTGFEGRFVYHTDGADPEFDHHLEFHGVNYHVFPDFLIWTVDVPWVFGTPLVLASIDITVPEPGQEITLQFLGNPKPSLEEPVGYPVRAPQIAFMNLNIEPLGSTSECLSIASAVINPAEHQMIFAEFRGSGEFGNVPTGTLSVRQIYLQNKSKQSIAGLVSVEGDGFSVKHGKGNYTVAPTWVTLQPDEELAIDVRFWPGGSTHAFGNVFFSSWGINACAPLAAHVDTDPVVTWEIEPQEFGPMYPGWSKFREATATNHSGDPVAISLYSENAAYTVDPADVQFTLQPGESRAVGLTCEPTLTGSIYGVIDTNNPAVAPLEALAHCYDYTPDCDHVWRNGQGGNFGNVTINYPHWRTVEFVNTSTTDTLSGNIHLTGMRTGFFIETGGGNVTLPPGKSHNVKIVAQPQVAGPAGDTLIGLGMCSFVPIQMSALAPVLAYEATPLAVAFGDVAVGYAKSSVLTLRNTGTVPVTGIRPDLLGDPAFSLVSGPANTVLQPGQVLTVVVQYAPTSIGEDNATFSFGLPGTDAIPLTGTGRAPMPICNAPESYDFRAVEIGHPAQKELVIWNTGELDLEIDITVTSDVFSIVAGGGPRTVNPNSFAAFTVEANPQNEGVASAVVETGAPECGDIVVSVSGYTGVVAIFTPSSLDFGTVEVGQAVPMSLVLTNVLDVTLSQIRLRTTGPFLVSPTGITSLVPDASVELTVSAFSLLPGLFMGELTTNYEGCGPVQLTAFFRDNNGGGGDGDGLKTVPEVTALLGCAPNPFNPTTDVRFKLASDGNVELAVFDLGGRRIRTLVSGYREAGHHVATWDGHQVDGRVAPSGVYYFRLQTRDGAFVQKASLLK